MNYYVPMTPEILSLCDVIHDTIMLEYSRINHVDDFHEVLDDEANTASHTDMERIISQVGLQTSFDIYQESGYEGFPTVRQLYYVVLEYCYNDVATYRGWDALNDK